MTFPQHIELGLYTREEVDNLFYGLRERCQYMYHDSSLVSTVSSDHADIVFFLRSSSKKKNSVQFNYSTVYSND